MTGSQRGLTTRVWLVAAALAVLLTGWPGVVAVAGALAYVTYRGRPRELVLLGAGGVGLTALVVVLEGLPSRATLSPQFVADNWLANALAAISLTLATIGILSDLSGDERPADRPAPLPVRHRARPSWRVVMAWAAVVLALGGGFAVIYVAAADTTAPAVEQQIADRLLAGDGFRHADEAGVDRPTAARMPVVPATLAVLAAGNVPPASERILWALAGIATAVASAAAASMLFGTRAAMVTGVLVLALPVFVIDHARRDSTALAALVLAVLAAVLARTATSQSKVWPVLGGGLGGLLALTRPEGLFIALAVLGAWLWTRPRSDSERVVPLVVLCVLLLLVGPWLLRNRNQTGTWWPSTSVGSVVAGSNAASTYRSGDFLGSYDPAAAAAATRAIAPDVTSEGRIASDLLRDGVKYAAGHPVLAIRAGGVRLLRAFELWPGGAEQRAQRARGVDVRAWSWRQVSFLVLLGLAAVGVARTARRQDLVALLPMLVGVATAALVAIFTYGDPVVRSVVDPLLAIMAGAAFARRRAQPQGAPSP